MNPRLELRGITREDVLRRARESMAKRRRGMTWVGGLISNQAHTDMHYLKDEWGLRTNREAIELALLYFGKATRDGLVHPGVPGSEGIPKR